MNDLQSTEIPESAASRVVIFAIVRPSGGPPLAVYAPTDVLAESLGAIGYSLLVVALATQAEMMVKLTELSESRACDAVLLWGNEDDVEEQGQLLERLGMPFVIKGHYEKTHPRWRQIDFDHVGMARGCVQLLASRGHHRIAYIGHDNPQVYAQTLLRGYKEAIADVHPIALPSHYILAIDELEHARSQVAERIEYWFGLSERQRPTAAVVAIPGGAWTDLEVALRAHGMRMGYAPKDFQVAGLAPASGRFFYGRAYCYTGVTLQALGEHIVSDLLAPLLSGDESAPRIVSYLPDLVPYDKPYFADEA